MDVGCLGGSVVLVTVTLSAHARAQKNLSREGMFLALIFLKLKTTKSKNPSPSRLYQHILTVLMCRLSCTGVLNLGGKASDPGKR